MIRMRLAAALFMATCIPAMALDHKQFCEQQLPTMAPAAYCSVNRSACNLDPRPESKAQIVARLDDGQQPRYNTVCRCMFSMFPPMAADDIQFLVERAQELVGVTQDVFVRKMVDECLSVPDDPSITR